MVLTSHLRHSAAVIRSGRQASELPPI